jgi:hypothetical protein
VLDEAEYLLNTSSQDHRKIRIEILTNGKGLKLLQKNNSEYAQKVSSLSQDYQNVQFMACRIAINRYRKEHGVSIQLLPNVQIVPSAMEEALSRQREGWTYLRI